MVDLENDAQRPLPNERRKADLTVVCGIRGSGKTYLGVHELARRHNRTLTLDPMDQWPGMEVSSGREAVALIEEHPRVHRIRTLRGDQEILEDFSVLAMHYGRCALICEELNRYIPPQSKMPPAFSDLVFRSRHRAVDVYLIAQRAGNIHPNARSQWTNLYMFRQTEPADTDWLRNVTSHDLPELESLGVGEYYHANFNGVRLIGRK